MKRFLSLCCLIVICFIMVSCNKEEAETTSVTTSVTTPTEQTVAVAEEQEVVILYMHDVQSTYLRSEDTGSLGFAAVAAYKKQLEDAGETVLLIDGGDAIEEHVGAPFSDGSQMVELMNNLDLFMAVPGEHEFDYGADAFLTLMEESADYPYVCCNLTDLLTGELIAEPYIMKEIGEYLVAFVGVSTPQGLSQGDSNVYLNENGTRRVGILGQESGTALYDLVQDNVDAALREGADYVIGVGHLGTDPTDTPWTSVELIMNTAGMTAFLDAHSHSLIAGEMIQDMDNQDVLLCSGGEKLQYLVELRLNLTTGAVSSALISQLEEDDTMILNAAQSAQEAFTEGLENYAAYSEVALVTHDEEGNRLIRKMQTNLGSLIADAYRIRTGADIGFVGAGHIQNDLPSGALTYGDIMDAQFSGSSLCVVEATGQQILDALEMAYRNADSVEFDGFLHVSGISFTFDPTLESTVKLSSKKELDSIGETRRIKDVQVGGTPIDPAATYTLAGCKDMLLYGQYGFNMFEDCVVTNHNAGFDYLALADYICVDLGGKISQIQYSTEATESRIVIITLEEE